MSNTKTFGGIKMTKKECSSSKASATAKAKAIRKRGFTARVETTSTKGKKTHCVYQGRKAKPNATQMRRKKRK